MGVHHPTEWDGGLSLNIVHRRVFGAVKGFVSGGLVGAASGFITGGGSSGSEPPSGSQPVPGVALVETTSADRCRQRGLRMGPGGRCVGPGTVVVDPTALLPGGRPGVTSGFASVVPMIGEVAVAPLIETQRVRRCPRGRVLAIDGACYNRKDLRKDQRMWPPGRKPLLTGGDLNAISRAARAAGRMKTQQKRLQKLGLLPKPKPAQRRIAAVSHHHD